MQPDGNWLPYAPQGLSQIIGIQESDLCWLYSVVDSIETQEFQQTGIQVQYSRRRLAQHFAPTPQGGYLANGVQGAAQHGLVREASFSQAGITTLAEYYAPPTPEQEAALQAEEAQWLKTHSIAGIRYGIPASEVGQALKVAPLICEVPNPNPDHFLEMLNEATAFNSEPMHAQPPVFIQPMPTVSAYNQIILTCTPMNTFVETMDYNGTIGIFVPVSDPSQLSLLNSIFNINLTAAPDGSIATQKTVVDK